MNNKINIVKADGSNVNVDIICYIENIATNAKYVYYTLNEVMGTGASSTIKIYVSKEKTGSPSDTPITDAEWNELKGYMADALKGNNNANVRYLPLPANIISISDKAIAMPVNYDYVNKQKGIYAESIATNGANTSSETSVIKPVTPVEPETVNVSNEPASTVMPADIPTKEIPQVPVTPDMSSNQNMNSNIPYQEPSFNSFNQPPIKEPNVSQGINPSMEVGPSNSVATSSKDRNSSNLEKINIEDIEAKYAKMIDDINKLKSSEIEAANRYNATLDLSVMHNEQHASYVQSEQIKENNQPQMGPSSMTMVEPEPIISSAPVGNNSMETNWFDMPQN